MGVDGTITVLADLQGGDGDVIPGSPATLAGYACVVMAYVQACPFCQGRYWTLDTCLHSAGSDELLDLMATGNDGEECADLFVFNDSQGRSSSFKAMMTIEPITRHPNGTGIYTVTGPFAVSSIDATHGRNGVSACAGGTFWIKAKERLDSELPFIESAINYHKQM